MNIDDDEYARYNLVEGVKVTLLPKGELAIERIPLSADEELDLPDAVEERLA